MHNKVSETLYLSKRNLLTLLSKLERFEQGQETDCTLIKYRNQYDTYQSSMDECMVIAVPDEIYYQNREPGEVYPMDAPNNKINTNEN